MKPEAQQIAIAEACGWRRCRLATQSKSDPVERGWMPPNPPRTPGWHERDKCPDYLRSLNAMHAAEKTLIAHSQQDRFTEKLWAVIGAGFYNSRLDRQAQDWILIHSSAAQRAEAFLRTIGKWVEE